MKEPIIKEGTIIKTEMDILIGFDRGTEIWETKHVSIKVNDQFIKAIIPYFTVTEEQLINLVSKMLTVLNLNGLIDDNEREFILGNLSADQLLDLKKQKGGSDEET